MCKHDTLLHSSHHHTHAIAHPPLFVVPTPNDGKPTSTTSSSTDGDSPARYGPVFTMTPEYGPPPYQVPGSVGRDRDAWDLWEMANWQMKRIKALWDKEERIRTFV